MFRRGRRRSSSPRRKAVQHFTCALANDVDSSTGINLNCANAGSYQLTGTSESTVRDALSNKQQECAVGSSIGRTTFDIGIRTTTASGILEYAVYKIERSNAIPALGSATLPSSATINSNGLQCAMRSFQPGRILEFGLLAYTAQTTRTKKLIINWKKYRMSTIRQGDFYGIVFFNRGGGDLKVDVYCRFKEWI